MSQSENDKYDPPETTAGDHLHTLARAGLGSIPGIGAAATELFQMVIGPPLQRRTAEWMNEIADGLKRLEEQHQCVFDNLADNDTFIDAVMQASQAATRTSQQEKREALRNAVLNSALPNSPDESRQQMFIALVDSLTVWHLRLFSLLADPLGWFQGHSRQPPEYASTSSVSRLIGDAFSELKNEREFYDQIGRDLYNHGLIGTDSFHTNMSASGAFEERATELGKQFIDFISAPPDDPDN